MLNEVLPVDQCLNVISSAANHNGQLPVVPYSLYNLHGVLLEIVHVVLGLCRFQIANQMMGNAGHFCLCQLICGNIESCSKIMGFLTLN